MAVYYCRGFMLSDRPSARSEAGVSGTPSSAFCGVGAHAVQHQFHLVLLCQSASGLGVAGRCVFNGVFAEYSDAGLSEPVSTAAAPAAGLCDRARRHCADFLPELRLSAAALPALSLCVAGTLFFCAGNLVSASLQKQHVPVMSANSWGMAYGCGVLSLYALVLGNPFIIDGGSAYLTGLVWLAVFSSVVAFACYLTLVGRIGAGRAGYATVIFPVFALLISTVFEGYSWTVLSAAGIGLVLAGNLLMLRSR